MALASYNDHTVIQQAMLEGLRTHFKAALQDEFQKVADKLVDEAVKNGMETFKVALEQFVEPEHYGRVVRVLLTDNRKPV